MEPIRVLQVIAKMDAGGAETFLMNMYRNVDRTKVQFDFLTYIGGEAFYNDEIKAMGGKIYLMPYLNISNVSKYIKALDEFLKVHSEYKIIHSNISATGVVPLYVAYKNNIPIRIAHSHTAYPTISAKSPAFYIFRKVIKKYCNYYFGCSKDAVCWLFGEKTVKNGSYKVINNAIETEKFAFNQSVRDEYRNKLQIKDKLVIGHIGRFAESKNHDFLLDIFSETHKKNEDSVLMLVGTGKLEKKIKQKVNDLELEDCVLFMGVRADVANLLQAMDVFLLPSIHEGLGIVSIEAQTAGLPNVISNVIPHEVAVTDLVKFVSLKKSAVEWADVVLDIDINAPRQNMRTEVLKAGYDVKDVAKKLESFYIEKAYGN